MAYGTTAMPNVIPDGHGVWTEDGATVAFYGGAGGRRARPELAALGRPVR